jgi:hypothetical protein
LPPAETPPRLDAAIVADLPPEVARPAEGAGWVHQLRHGAGELDGCPVRSVIEAFLQKKWPEAELHALNTRRIEDGLRLLPIWHNVDRLSVFANVQFPALKRRWLG